MKKIRQNLQSSEKLHHAYGFFGEREQILNEIIDFLEQDLNFKTKGNADFWHGEFNVLKIDDSRAISLNHLKKPVNGQGKFFVISTNFITRDAQNSLLKMFEEPQAETVFFLVAPETIDLLPTLKSRLITYYPDAVKAEDNQAVTFLKGNLGKRLKITADLLKELKDEKITKSEIIDFLKKIEKELKDKKNLLGMEDLEKAISYSNDESPSMKVILEHLAVTL